jgi:hypothetical protein
VWPLRRFVELRAIRIPRLAVPDAAVEGEVP